MNTAPRVLIANSNLVGNWSNWDEFRRLEALGLMMYGQMTAGSWIYIGSQGIIQGTYETFSAVARQHFGGDLRGRVLVSGGLGGMGGAQPLAATMAGAAFLGIEVDPQRIEKRLRTGYCDRISRDLDEALAIGQGGGAPARGGFRRARRQLRRSAPGTGAPRLHPGRPHRPDQRPRPAQRLHPRRTVGGRRGHPAPARSRGHTSAGAWTRSPRTSAPCSRCRPAGR